MNSGDLVARLPPEPTSVAELLDAIRARGWMVAVHNDYRQLGTLMTFWLFTGDEKYVKAEARSDLEALTEIWKKIEGR